MSLCLPNGLPTKYAPESAAQIVKTRLNKTEGSYAPEFCQGSPITMHIHNATNAAKPQTVASDERFEPILNSRTAMMDTKAHSNALVQGL